MEELLTRKKGSFTVSLDEESVKLINKKASKPLKKGSKFSFSTYIQELIKEDGKSDDLKD